MDSRLSVILFAVWTVLGSSQANEDVISQKLRRISEGAKADKEREVRGKWPWIDEQFPQPVQSPVDISTFHAKKENLPDFSFENYWENKKEIVTLRNDGHTVLVSHLVSNEILEGDRPFIKGGPLKDDYVFEQMHMHWGKTDGDGSEHTLNGRTLHKSLVGLPTELSLHRRNQDTRMLSGSRLDGGKVPDITQARGDDNEALAGYIEGLERVRRCNSSVDMAVQRMFKSVKELATARTPAHRYYAYPGSLTTPPFSESVIWIVFPDPFQLSPRQLKKFRHLRSCEGKELIRKNDRKLQPFNNRPVIYAY